MFLKGVVTDPSKRYFLNIQNIYAKNDLNHMNDYMFKLNKKLSSVGFNCKNQSVSGVYSVNESIVDSINNRWAMRKNGQKRLKTINMSINLS